MGLPEQYKTRNLGSKVGETLGRVLETDLFSLRGKEDRLLKTKVMLDITKPLRRSIKISGINQKVTEVNLKYECIGNFCYYYGFIGHKVRNCQQNLEDTAVGQSKEEQWGSWLRAEQVGRKIENLKENQNPKKPKKEEERRQTSRKPTPVNLICTFAILSVQEGNLQNSVAEVGFKPKNRIIEGGRGQKEVGESDPRLERRKQNKVREENLIEAANSNNLFNFKATSRSEEGNGGSKPKLKQYARRKPTLKLVSGSKRSNMWLQGIANRKRQCQVVDTSTSIGEGATDERIIYTLFGIVFSMFLVESSYF
ncbi:hypothetical protein Ahy_B03g065634 [Arachis hypogaea]|uniref:Zinc knuckle CX2CX4HX4C domain-containing protein n=1 Tax=Arachis hypogaea TaxID=3818 RepID=A0A445A233_ARAHY|nr:hypothetical protein Ahy_B03g065634 [Arachis hypogaea]